MTTTEHPSMSAASIHTVAGGAGTALHVREWGRPDGPALLLIHGWSGNHLCWDRQVTGELSEEFRIVALDLRGHGMSDRPLNADLYTDSGVWAADVAAVIDQRGLDRPVLVGWSYGGFIISDYVRAYGQDGIGAINFVAAAVTLDATFSHIGPAFLAAAPAGADADLPTRIAGLRRFWHSMTAEPLELADLETGLCGSVSVPSQVLAALVSRQIDSDDVLSELRVPVLVSHGRQDQVVSPSMADHILRVCPAAQASWYDMVGHAPFLEDPARFNRELAALARRVAV
ncbi:MAG TPA: alpha/beta hydrolase [Microlunatus sp.]|jgi:non-heme chloroperoxidase|nr:alpha/beta hydrolase [Microlunatus sp.]